MSHWHKLRMFLRAQALLVACFSLLILLVKGQGAALSALSGGCVALTGGAVYVLILRKVDCARPEAVLYLHFMAEIAKLCTMFVAVVILYLWFKQVEWLWILSGCLVAYSAYWFGLLIKN